MELHGGVHPGVGVVPDPVRAHTRGLVSLVCRLEVALASELVALRLHLPEDGVLIRSSDAHLVPMISWRVGEGGGGGVLMS